MRETAQRLGRVSVKDIWMDIYAHSQTMSIPFLTDGELFMEGRLRAIASHWVGGFASLAIQRNWRMLIASGWRLSMMAKMCDLKYAGAGYRS